ncbi:uncharacterized protein [Anabrus simplex]|uniref:uncharacterized protein isoform X4 n=1 Tax=Anabrus simplex TaxID=316456 RepID=UPI0034DD5CB0
MSVSDPSLKELKGLTLKLVQASNQTEINDSNVHLQPFCQSLEHIFQKGLLLQTSSLGFPRSPESWYWLEEIANKASSPSYNYISSVNTVKLSQKVVTAVGKLRHLIRICLVNRCLHVPVEILIRQQQPGIVYNVKNSIIGDDILGEIFLSVLLQCSRLTFNLNVKNCSFLDDTWMLPVCEQLEFVPCKVLGISISFVNGKAIVIGVKENSVAAEDHKIQIGDILDELNGVHITTSTRNKLSKIMKKAANQPVMTNIIKAHCGSDYLYPPIINLLRRCHIDPNEVKSMYLKTKTQTDDQQELKNNSSVLSSGFSVIYVGCITTGSEGDVKQIELAMTALFSGVERISQPGSFEIQEIGVRVVRRDSGDVIVKHSYMEISSCGRTLMYPRYFAYIAGDESCSVAKSFTCFVFHCSDEDLIYKILQSIGQGFQRTHFAV